MNRKHALVLIACLGLAVFLVADGATAQQVFKKKDGTFFKGYLLKDSGTDVSIRTQEGKVDLKYSDLAPDTVFWLREKRTPEDNAQAQMNLAEYALKHKIFHGARKHFVMAVLADPSFKDKAVAGWKRTETSQRRFLIEKAAEARKTGNRQLEQAILSLLMTNFPDSKEAEKAEKMLDELKEAGDDLEGVIARLDKSAQKLIEDGRKSFNEALEYNRKGLKASRKKSQAERHFKRALKKLRHCEVVLHKIREEYDQNFELMKAAKEAEKKLEDRQIRVLINIAHLYSSRQSFIKALEYVNRALLVDENSQLANETRSQIELAMNAGRRGGGWR